MIASVDGATTVAGVSGGLGGPADHDLLALLRSLADPVLALDVLGGRGHRAVLAEGGPTLNAQLAGAGLLDELCLSLSPRLVGGAAKRILDGLPVPGPAPLRLCSVCEQDGFLFLRYRPG
jgi:riboflavin biosynthesis pyrimidine reductase